MFVFVFYVHSISISVRIRLVGSCCLNFMFRNCFCVFLSVYINRFGFLLRVRSHVKYCSIVLTKAIFSLNSLTVNYSIHLLMKSQGLVVSLLQFGLCKQLR